MRLDPRNFTDDNAAETTRFQPIFKKQDGNDSHGKFGHKRRGKSEYRAKSGPKVPVEVE